jgi:glucose/arabinose dehydrogenase
MLDALNAVRVADGLSFPTSLALDATGRAYVAESGLPFGGAPAGGRILRIEADGSATCLQEGLRQPVNGLHYHEGVFYIAEGGSPGRISRLSLDGQWEVLLDSLPGFGNYHTNMAVVGPDGKLYFSQGAMTNSGVMGLDSYDLGWLKSLPHTHDIPGYDIVLTGVNHETVDPLHPESETPAATGAFSPFGAPSVSGQRLVGSVPCTAAMMRCQPDGSDLELVAWGLRNAYGLGFLPDGRLLATDQGADDRGSRPIGKAPDLLYEVRDGAWYGWPDYIGGVPVTDPSFVPERGSPPKFLLANHAELPQPASPLLRFPANVAAVKFAVAPQGAGPWAGHLFVALFGDEKPMTAPIGGRVGRSIVRIDPRDWSLHPCLDGPFRRPIDVAFSADGETLYVLDFGEFEMDARYQVQAQAGTGALWSVQVGSQRSLHRREEE